MNFKATRNTTTEGKETPESVWEFLKANPLSSVEGKFPYLGTVLLSWSVRQEYWGQHPEDAYTKNAARSQKVILTDVVVLQGGNIRLFARTAEELGRFLSRAIAHCKKVASA